MPIPIFLKLDRAKKSLPQIDSMLTSLSCSFTVDDLDVAYENLSQLVKEYLGLSEETAKSLAPPEGTILSLLSHNCLFFMERKTNL